MELAGNLLELSRYEGDAAAEVEIFDLQAQQLALSKSGGDGEQIEGAKAVTLRAWTSWRMRGEAPSFAIAAVFRGVVGGFVPVFLTAVARAFRAVPRRPRREPEGRGAYTRSHSLRETPA